MILYKGCFVSLFRQQAVDHRKQRLYGNVLLLPRLSHTLILGGLIIWVALVLAWLFSSTYARKETVVGWLEPPAGVVRLYPESSGTIQKILIDEGALVSQNQPLMIIKTDAQLASGQQLSEQLLKEYESQRNLIEEEIKRTDVIYSERTRDISKKILASQQEYSMLGEQLNTVAQRYQLILIQSERFKKLKRDGHVSISEFDSAMQQELLLKSDQQALMRNQITQKNLIEQYQTQKALLPDEKENELAQLRSKLSDITQQVAQVSGQSTRVLKASRAGIINNLQAREGQQISLGSSIPLLTLIPQDEQLTAHLLIPVRSAGFLALGQTLNIRYDAFPYEKFGLYQGEISQISKTILLPNELLNTPIAIQEPVYRITVHLMQPNVQAYGKNFPLKPGMTLSADIRLSDRTLIQWLLEPLYSLNGRI